MTSLLTALREHPQVAALTSKVKSWTFEHTDTLSSEDGVWEHLDARDRALVTACLQEAAKRIREIPAGDFAAGYWKQKHADYLDQMAKESAE